MLLLIALLTTTLHAQVVRRSPRRDTSHLDTDDEGCVFDEQHRRHCLPRLVGVASVRGGSTSLAACLNFHRRLTWGERKEHQFFRFRGDLAGALEDRVGAEWAGRVPPGHAPSSSSRRRPGGRDQRDLARRSATAPRDPATSPRRSTGSSGEGVAPPGMPGARDKRNALSWRDYALEFPVAAGELAFDFDPVYLARTPASFLF
ncbi:hypothetical protein SO694_00193037 [Aureococcus anophagefferens]|uniref:Uncharacterized protein n=1 Tax=Aureococcus anophagefferens TaxID=44056 RepID=A0ABR1FNZ9_AURAN